MVGYKKGLGFLGVCVVVCSLVGASDDAPGVEFSFDSKRNVQEHPKFTHEQKIAAALARLCRQCTALNQRNAPQQMIIDAARALVLADDEYKAEGNPFTAFFFAHPHARDASLFMAGVTSGAFGFWILS